MAVERYRLLIPSTTLGSAERLVLGDVTEQSAHDLARAGLRQVLGEEDRLRFRDRADRLTDVLAEFRHQLVARFVPGPQDDERRDGLTGGGIGLADDRGLGDRREGDQRRFHLGGGDVVPGDEHDVVDPTEEPVVAVGVGLGAVAGEVPPGEA